MSAWVIYSLVLIFFLLFPLLVLFFVRTPEAAVEQSKTPIDKTTYGFLAALFALVFVLTFFVYKQQSHR